MPKRNALGAAGDDGENRLKRALERLERDDGQLRKDAERATKAALDVLVDDALRAFSVELGALIKRATAPRGPGATTSLLLALLFLVPAAAAQDRCRSSRTNTRPAVTTADGFFEVGNRPGSRWSHRRCRATAEMVGAAVPATLADARHGEPRRQGAFGRHNDSGGV